MSTAAIKKPKVEGESGPTSGSPGATVVHNNTLDLEAYSSQYQGHGKVRRLVYIAHTCPELQVRAYQLLIEELKKGLNKEAYIEAISTAREALGDALGEEYALDTQWVQKLNRQLNDTQAKLEHELNNQKRDQERDPTRRAYEALGDFYVERGDFQSALAHYTAMKDYCASHNDTLTMCLKVIRASVHSGTMSYVQSHASRAKTIPELPPAARALINSALGLYHLRAGNYRLAAENFLDVPSDVDSKCRDILTGKDVAVYGTMCALASYSRPELKARVLANSDFRKSLELAPAWKKLVDSFYTSHYAQCFTILAQQQSDVLLDLYMASHFDRLRGKIRDRALVQYFKPFTSVQLSSMAESFAMSLPDLERLVVHLIGTNEIQGRIDSANKVLYARHADQRTHTFQQALNVGNRYLRDTRTALLRMSLVENQFTVKAPRPAKKEGEETEGKDKA